MEVVSSLASKLDELIRCNFRYRSRERERERQEIREEKGGLNPRDYYSLPQIPIKYDRLGGRVVADGIGHVRAILRMIVSALDRASRGAPATQSCPRVSQQYDAVYYLSGPREVPIRL